MLYSKNKFSGFTLIEILVSVLLFSIIITAGFQALASIGVGKIKLIQKTNIEKQAFFTSEKFFELIKKGGSIDYEEYFNRKIVGKTITNGHFDKKTGYGNFGAGLLNSSNVGTTSYGDGFYYCRSGNGNSNTYGDYDNDNKLFEKSDDFIFQNGCNTRNNYNGNKSHINIFNNNYAGSPQRYGQYSFQFIDYNANKDYDKGDVNGDGSPIIDDDDENLGTGPTVFEIGEELPELYLIDLNKKERTFFRWNIVQDPDDTMNFCNTTTGGDGCLGNIEFIKLSGKDFGFKHNPSSQNNNFGLNDGVIDTWTISDDFSGTTDKIAGSDDINYRQPIFPNTMNVKNVKFILYPNKDNNLAWKDDSNSLSSISPFVKIYMTLAPSEKKKRSVAGKIPEINIATTINLGSN